MAYKKPPFQPLVSTADRMRVFGEFDYSVNADGTIRFKGDWAKRNIIQVTIPQLVGVEGAPAGGRVWVHHLVAEQMKRLFEAWEQAGLMHLVLSWGGSFVPRLVRGGKSLSNHAFGTAFDINAAWNPLGREPAAKGKRGSVVELVEIAHQFGFYWGGHFSRKDGMHFEVAVVGMSPTQPVEAAADAATAAIDISPDQASDDTADSTTVALEPATGSGPPDGSSDTAADRPSALAAATGLVSSPDSPVMKVATGNTGLAVKGGAPVGIIASIIAWVETHPGLVITIIICATVLLLAVIFREFIEKRLEALTNADPTKHNIRFTRKG